MINIDLRYNNVFHVFEFSEHSVASCISFVVLCAAVFDVTEGEEERRKLLAISFFNLLIPDEPDEARSCPLLDADIPFWLAPIHMVSGLDKNLEFDAKINKWLL